MTTPTPGLYEQVLAAAGGALPPRKPPRPSASVVPWRRGASGAVEIFWLKRGAALPFMGGWQAFPGGALDRGDAERAVDGSPAAVDAGSWTQASSYLDDSPRDPDLVPGLAACALRELEEECGLRPQAPSSLPDASRLLFAGRWLTPPFAPVRFDNRFFLLEWRPEDGEARAVPPESESGEWIEPGAALARIDSGSALAAPPILHLLGVLAECDPEDPRAPTLLRDTTGANLGPMRRIELRRGVLLFPVATATLPPATHTNAYLLGTRKVVLVDPGSADAGENERLLAAIVAANRQLGREVVAIWLTHHHPDHVGGVAAMRRALGVPVLAHRATAERVPAFGIAVDGELADGQVVELDADPEPFRVRVHHTPGHARGHLAFEVGRDEVGGDLIAGDLVAAFSTIVIDPPEGNMSAYLDSLVRMRDRKPRTLFVAHGAPFVDAVAKLEEYRLHRLERESQVLAAWRAGERSAAAMVPAIYSDVPSAIHPLAERQVLAHLARLAEIGEIVAMAD